MTTTDKIKLLCGAFDPDRIDPKEIHLDFDGVHDLDFDNDYGGFTVTVYTYCHPEDWGVCYEVLEVRVSDVEFYDPETDKYTFPTDEELDKINEILYQNL